MQSRRHTIYEVLTGTTTGSLGSWLITWAVLSWSPLGNASNATITVALCTVWSLVRGYAVRRMFNRAAVLSIGGTGHDQQLARGYVLTPHFACAVAALIALAVAVWFFLT